MLEAEYLREADQPEKAALRAEQAAALAQSCGISLSEESITPEELDAFFEETQRGLK